MIENLTLEYSKEEKQKRIKLVCTNLLKAFKKVCDEYSFTWWVDGGTLIGTMRDGKMIAWDDDIDVTMPRQDYDELCKLCQMDINLFGKYFFQTSLTDKCFEVHAKLRDPDTCALTPREFSGTHNRGMFLDIYPLDNAPKDLSLRKDIASFVRTLAKHSGQENKFEKTSKFYFLNSILADIGKKHFDSGYIANMAFWRYDKKLITFSKDTYDVKKTRQAFFEDVEVPIPAKAEQVLKAWYGPDWKTPRQEPNGHHAFIDPFHKYRLYNNCTKKDFENLIK